MNYLEGVFNHISPDWTDRTRIARLSNEAEALRVLRQRGYKIVLFHSGYASVESINPDVTRSAGWVVDEFSQGLLDTTVIPYLSLRRGLSAKYHTRRKDVLFAMEHLGDTSDFGGPALVIAHIVSPHEPFLFGANGEEISISGETCSKDVYKQAYRDQLVYVNRSILPAIDRILANSKRPPVIVLTADHGPCAAFASGSRTQTDLGMRERFSILNAYYFPKGKPESLHESVSSVNTFRIIFNHCLGMDYELLEDRSFLSSEARPYDLVEVTDILLGKTAPQE